MQVVLGRAVDREERSRRLTLQPQRTRQTDRDEALSLFDYDGLLLKREHRLHVVVKDREQTRCGLAELAANRVLQRDRKIPIGVSEVVIDDLDLP